MSWYKKSVIIKGKEKNFYPTGDFYSQVEKYNFIKATDLNEVLNEIDPTGKAYEVYIKEHWADLASTLEFIRKYG